MDKRFILPVAMLAGALALAGCGGGSDTPAASPGANPPANGTNPGTTANGGFKEVTVAGGFTLSDDDEGRSGQIETGDEDKNIIGNVLLTCPDTATNGCRWRVKDGQVEATGGATGKRHVPPPAPEADTSDRTAAGPQGTANWLSNRALIGAIKEATGSDGTYVELAAPNGAPVRVRAGSAELDDGGKFLKTDSDTADSLTGAIAGADHDINAGSDIGSATVVVGEGLKTHLRLVHTRNRMLDTDAQQDDADRENRRTDYLVYGAWETRAGSGDTIDEAPQADNKYGYLWTGTIPRTDAEAWQIGEADYKGKALGHYTHGSDAGEWDGTVNLKANFAKDVRAVRGEIRTGLAAATGLDEITLEQAGIGANVRGDVSFDGRQVKGTWKAGFFGASVNGQPNGMAGDFSAGRPTIAAGTITTPRPGGGTFTQTQRAQTPATIDGAFGAHNVGDIPN